MELKTQRFLTFKGEKSNGVTIMKNMLGNYSNGPNLTKH